MAASPATAIPPVSSDTHPSPNPPSSPGPRPSQESPSLIPAASNPNHATSGPPTPAEQSTVEHSESDQPPPPPIDEAKPPPPPPLLEAAPAASRAHEATSTEKLASLSPHPADVAVQVSPKVSSSSPSRSPSPSPKIVEASPEEAPQLPSPPCTPPATAACASTDPSTAEAMEMASREAARPSPTTESMDADSHTAPSPPPPPPPPPPIESVPEGLLPQQQPGPQSLAMAPPLCENSESTRPPLLCHLSEGTDASPDEGVPGTSAKASGSSPVPESTDEDTDTTPGLLPALEIGQEEMLPQQQPRPPCPEIVPLQGENSKLLQSSQLPTPAESSCWNAGGNGVSAVASEEAAPPGFEAIDAKAALEIGPERSSQEPVGTPTSSRMEAEPSSPDMAPPGFEDYKSQWLPLPPPNPPAESTDTVVQVAATIAMATAPDAATESLSSLEAMDVEKDISLPGLLSPSKSWVEGRPQQPLLGSCSPTTEAAPCSPDMPPPGFENCKSSWLLLPTLHPVVQTTYTLPDMASTKAASVAFVEKTCSMPVLEATDVETDAERRLLPPLESGTGSSLQGQLPRSCSPMMQATPCSPDIAPPGFENLKLTQLQPPYPPVAKTALTLQDSATDEAMYVTSEEAPLPSRASEAMDLDMDATAALAPPSESKRPERSLQPEPPLLPSHVAHYTACSQGMAPLGSENVECSQMLQTAVVLPLHQTPDALADAETKKTVTMEEVCYPLPVAGATEEANGILSPALENGCEGQLPDLEPQASSPAVHAVATSPEMAPTSFENLESSQLKSPIAETKTIDPSAHEPAIMPVIAKSEKTSQLSPSQATDTYIESATLQQSPLKREEKSSPQSAQHPSSPSVKDTTCSPEVAPPGYEKLDSEQLPPPPPLTSKLEIGQMVCGCCRQLLAYPRGAVHVQCRVCWTINHVLEEHQVSKVYCGQCDTLLMYPFGAPAVKCSNCLFVTEIGERNVRSRISMEQSVSPHAHEVAHPS